MDSRSNPLAHLRVLLPEGCIISDCNPFVAAIHGAFALEQDALHLDSASLSAFHLVCVTTVHNHHCLAPHMD